MLQFSSISKGAIHLRKLHTVPMTPLKLYTTIDFLPIRNFYMIVETGDHRWLIKGIDYENLPNAEIDSLIWEKIWGQYIEISKDRDYQIYFETLRKYSSTNTQYEVLKAEIFSLYFRFNAEYAKDLEAEGIILNMNSRGEYLESLNIATKRLRNKETRIKILEKELESKTKKSTVKIEFLDLVNQIEQLRGIPINIDTMSIKQFVLLINKHNEYGKRAD